MRLTGVEICYDSSDPNVALGRGLLSDWCSTDAGGASGSIVLDDGFPPDGNQCQNFSGSPQLMGTNSFAYLQLRLDWSASATDQQFNIQRTTFFLEPSNRNAAAL